MTQERLCYEDMESVPSEELSELERDCLLFERECGIRVKAEALWHYHRMREAGESHNMAAMLALRAFPGTRGTDSSFMAGTHHQDTPIDRYRHEAAQAAGIDTNGKRYISGLARFPNDPEAWISGLSDVRRIVTERNWNCSGAFDHRGYVGDTSREPEGFKGSPVSPDIIQESVQARLADRDPRECTPELIEETVDQVSRVLNGQIDPAPQPKVSDYDDPFSLPGMQPDSG